MGECISHHWACDCREAKFKKMREALENICEITKGITLREPVYKLAWEALKEIE